MATDTLPARAPETAPTAAQEDPYTPMMLAAMQSSQDPVAALERVIALRDRERADQRRLAYLEARARFLGQCPPIPRRKGIPDQYGNIKYRYAPIETVIEVAGPHLEREGFSWAFDVVYIEGGGAEIGCTLSHSGGHSERSPVRMPGISIPKANAAQNEGGRITYGKRIALLDVTGIVTADEDTDAAEDSPDEPSVKLVTDDQALTLAALADEVGCDAQATFFKPVGITSWAELPARMYQRAVKRMEKMREGDS